MKGWRQPAEIMDNVQAVSDLAPAVKYQPKPRRYYFDVALGSILLSGEDTGGAYCLLEMRVAPGKGVPRHTHTREDEALFVLSGELEVSVGDETFTLRAGQTLIAPRNIPHQLSNSGNVPNHYLIMFSPAGFEEFLKMTSVPAPDDAVAPIEPPTIAIRNVFELATDYGIQFG
jgi:quercetin dioxygenase-like cupin family protein